MLSMLSTAFLSSCLFQSPGSSRPFQSDSAVDPVTPTDGSILIHTIYACKGTKPIGINSYEKCLTNSSSLEQIFIQSNLSAEASKSTGLSSVKDWCAYGETKNETASCVILAVDAAGVETEIEISSISEDGKITANIGSLQKDKTYAILVKKDPSEKISNYLSFNKLAEMPAKWGSGALAVTTAKRYECRFIAPFAFDKDGKYAMPADLSKDLISYPMNYFYSNVLPTDAGNAYYYCKNNNAFINLNTTALKIWSPTEARFKDQNNDSIHDIHNFINWDLLYLKGLKYSQPKEIFQVINWDRSPKKDTEQNVETAPILGYVMKSFIDSVKNEAHCPDFTKTEEVGYGIGNLAAEEKALFSIVKSYVGAVVTQALYVGERIVDDGNSTLTYEGKNLKGEDVSFEAQPLINYLPISETELTAISVTTDDGNTYYKVSPKVKDKEIRFFWPKMGSNPAIRQAGQYEYRIKAFETVSSSNDDKNNDPGYIGPVQPHDNRVGCILK